MSMATKVAIGAGVVVVGGTILYALTRKKAKKA
jgi:hypothetical protein